MQQEIKLKIQYELELLIEKYISNIEQDLKDRWNEWEKDVSVLEQYEVIGAMMSRQITIAINFVNNSSIWNGHIAPLIMRSLIDNYINFAWILINPIERSKQFIYYGLGQEKLNLEHFKAQFNESNSTEQVKKSIEAREGWINSQRYDFLTDVSFKSWSEKNTRQMAEESNCLDLYNFAYTPFSGAVHNSWNHIGKYNTQESDNPLHKFMRKPAIYKFNTETYYLELTVKYVSKMFRRFDEKYQYTSKRDSFNEFHKALDDIFLKYEGEETDDKNNKS